MERSTIHNSLAVLILISYTAFLMCYTPDTNEEHDINFREQFCNNEYRQRLDDLPEHLRDACQKSDIDLKDIYVFKENSDAAYYAHTVGSNVMLTNSFWELDNATQAWYFAHELSHVKHGDTEHLWKFNQDIIDFQIASSAGTILALMPQLSLKRMRSLPGIIGTLCLWGGANIVALHKHFSKIQQMELRANEEATRAVGSDAAITFLKKIRWYRDHSQNLTILRRLNVHKERFGFCTHGSAELQLSKLKKIQKTEKAKNAEKKYTDL